MYPADSVESIHLAIIQELEIQPCAELENLQFPAEIAPIKQLLCEDYFSVVDHGDKVAILVENIVSKCFDISAVGLCTITRMVSASEVIK